MYCPSCGKAIADGSAFCMYCGKATGLASSLSGTPVQHTLQTQWEYKDLFIDLRSHEINARLGTQVTRAGARLEWWSHLRPYVLEKLQAWTAWGWEPVAAIGPDCLILDEERKTDLITGGDGIFNRNTYVRVQGVRIQMRRQIGTESGELNADQSTNSGKKLIALVNGLFEVSKTLTPLVPIRPDNAKQIVEVGIQDGYSYVKGIRYTADGRYLVTSTHANYSVWVWPLDRDAIPDATPIDRDARPEFQRIQSIVNFKPFIAHDVATIEGGLIAVGLAERALGAWDLSSGRRLYSHEIPYVTGVDLSPDNKYIAIATDEKTIQLRQIIDGKVVRVLRSNNPVEGAYFSPDGRILATWHLSWNNHLHFWKVSDGTVLNVIKKAGNVESIREVYDGQSILTRVWPSLAFSPDGQRLAVRADPINIFNLENGTYREHNAQLRSDAIDRSQIRSLAFSPDGRILASGLKSGQICLWGVESGKLLHILAGHTATVNSLSFAPAEHILASGSDDHTVRFWGLK